MYEIYTIRDSSSVPLLIPCYSAPKAIRRRPRVSPASLLLPSTSGRRSRRREVGGSLGSVRVSRLGPRVLGVRARLASPMTVAVAPVNRASSSPSFPRSGLAGEVVEVLRQMLSSISVSPAGRGGEGSWRWLGATWFWCWCCRWSSSPASLLWPAEVARGAVFAGVSAARMVDLGGAASAGRRVVLGSPCCGRVLSLSSNSVAGRRMDVAVGYNAWRRVLPGGVRYGDAGVG